jgi:hypothetical protein
MAGSPDIYGYDRDGSPQAVFSADTATLTFGDIDAASGLYMIQDWQVGYAQDVQEIFELGSSNIYWVRGRPQGQGQVNRIVGGVGFQRFFPAAAFDVCQGGAGASIAAASGTCEGAGATVSLNIEGVIVTNLGFSSSVQGASVVRQGVTFKFSKLSPIS